MKVDREQALVIRWDTVMPMIKTTLFDQQSEIEQETCVTMANTVGPISTRKSAIKV